MDLLEIIILGLTQGLTEFIPVSSSGHLVLVQQVFSGASNHLLLEFINIGTLLALLVFFRKRIGLIIKDIFLNKNFILARNLIITSIPAGIIGFMLSDFIASSAFFGSVVVVTIMLALVGVIMIMIEKLPKASPIISAEQLSPVRSLMIGFAQVCALIPGVSRSGSTIIAGRLAGLKSADAAEYSFLASLPIMTGVTLKLFIDSTSRAYFAEHAPLLIVVNFIAFVSGLFAVKFVINFVSKHGIALFGWYRLLLATILGVIILIQ